MWLELQRNEVVPALKKAGVEDYTTYQTVVGEVTEFVIVRPFAFAELRQPRSARSRRSAPRPPPRYARSSATARKRCTARSKPGTTSST